MEKGPSSPEAKTVLIVDPDADLARALAADLTAAGRKVVSAVSGEEGLTLARARRPDLLVIEALLPRADGFTITRLLKSDARFRNLPVIMVSARRRAQDILRAEETGAAIYVTKPFDSAHLRTLIDGLLARGGKKEFSVEYSPHPAPPPSLRPPPSAPVVLIVGGEEETVRRFQPALRAGGFEVLLFSRGEEALNAARAKDPVCLIAATALPGMDGYTLCLLLKYDGRFQHVPVFLLSSRLHPYEAERGKTVKADGHIVPSCEPGELLRMVRQAMKESVRLRASRVSSPLWMDGSNTLRSQ